MIKWLKKRKIPFWLLAVFCLAKLYEFFLHPIVAINIENWAIKQEIHDEFLDGGAQTIPFFKEAFGKFLSFIDPILNFLGSGAFFGFVLGSMIFGFWDPVLRYLASITVPHPSLSPRNGLHPAILSFRYNCGQGLERLENYGVERWYYSIRNKKINFIIFFERKTSTQNIEISTLSGDNLIHSILYSDERMLVFQFSKRAVYEGLKVCCYESRNSKDRENNEADRPLLPADYGKEVIAKTLQDPSLDKQ